MGNLCFLYGYIHVPTAIVKYYILDLTPHIKTKNTRFIRRPETDTLYAQFTTIKLKILQNFHFSN